MATALKYDPSRPYGCSSSASNSRCWAMRTISKPTLKPRKSHSPRSWERTDPAGRKHDRYQLRMHPCRSPLTKARLPTPLASTRALRPAAGNTQTQMRICDRPCWWALREWQNRSAITVGTRETTCVGLFVDGVDFQPTWTMLRKMWRTLAYEDPRQGRTRIGQDEIAAFSQPVVILGDPGLGKSVLTEAFGEMSGMNYVLAGTLTRSAEPESLIIYGRVNHRRRARRDRLRSARQRGRSRVEATFGNGQSTL